MSADTRKVISKECRFVTFVPPAAPGRPDLHVVKEILHYDDNTTGTNLLGVYDYKRPFWITKKGYRNHESKKEWEDEDRLTKFMTTETELTASIYRGLGEAYKIGGKNLQLRKANGSPYVYGSDILGTAIIKQAYFKKYPITPTRFSMGVLDTETDVVHGTGEIVMASFTYKKIVHTAIVKSFVAGYSDVEHRVKVLADKYIGDVLKAREAEIEVVLVDNAIKAVVSCINAAHKARPDFLAFWNMDFDISKIIDACERYGVDPKDVFSDPDIPKEYKYFKYKRGPDKKVTASGKVTPIKPAMRWHTVFTPASFYPIDAMCAYRHIRMGQQELPSYSLDSVLNTHKVKGKLKFEECAQYSGLRWHQEMQKNYPLEYAVYNIYDCVCVELLEEKTGDLGISLPMFSGCSDFQHFRSQPRRIVDDMHFFVQEKKKKVIGSTGEEMSEEVDSSTLGLEGWIITLPAHAVADNGMQVISEFPDLKGNIRQDVGDLDVSASYPRGQLVFNISKETTKKELITIHGIDEYTFRMQNINLSGGSSNALEYCQQMFGFPDLPKMLEAYQESKTN